MAGPEAKAESLLVKLTQQRGGLCYKFISPANPGVPDRIVITPEGRTIYVELKHETGRLQKIQVWQLDRMKNCNAEVRVLKGVEEVKAFVEEVMPE